MIAKIIYRLLNEEIEKEIEKSDKQLVLVK